MFTRKICLINGANINKDTFYFQITLINMQPNVSVYKVTMFFKRSFATNFDGKTIIVFFF